MLSLCDCMLSLCVCEMVCDKVVCVNLLYVKFVCVKVLYVK